MSLASEMQYSRMLTLNDYLSYINRHSTTEMKRLIIKQCYNPGAGRK